MRSSVQSNFFFRESIRRGHGVEMVVTLALILTFSPGEKEQLLAVSGLANDCPANPATRHFKKAGRRILPTPPTKPNRGKLAFTSRKTSVPCRVKRK